MPVVATALAIGCGQPTPSSEPSADEHVTATVFNPSSLPTVQLDVPAIHCEACAMGVTAALQDQPGVKDVTVDVATKVATVAVDESEFDPKAAIAALDAAEFTGSTLKTPETPEAAPAREGQEG